MATDDRDLQFKTINELLKLFQKEFGENGIPAVIGTLRDRIIRRETGNNDPYSNEKVVSNEIALMFEPILDSKIAVISDPHEKFRFTILISIVGNVIEFNIQDHDVTTENLHEKLATLIENVEEELVIDHVEEFYNSLKPGSKILYLTDNAGEILFDKFLIKELNDIGMIVTVAVKGEPALNDAMMEDAIKVGLDKINGVNLITTENDNVGIIIEEISPGFMKVIQESDIIIAKGMGYFECLYGEQTLKRPIFHLFRTKCYTVADSLGVEIGKNISLFIQL